MFTYHKFQNYRQMSNNQNAAANQGLDFWTNELIQLENALDGIRTSYAIVSSLREQAQNKVDELTPEKEEIEE